MSTNARRVWKFILLWVMSETAWLLLGTLVVPSIMTRAYDGKSIAAINSFFIGQPQPLAFYLQHWRDIVHLGVLFWVALWAFVLLLTSSLFWQRFVGEAPPEAVG